MPKDSRITPGNRVREIFVHWADVSPLGQRAAYWIGKTASGLQLRLKKLYAPEAIPWTPLKKPLAEATIALVTTGGVHLCTDRPFNIVSDSSYRKIPRAATAEQLCITHDRYDRRDAARDINLVFPLERLRELEQEGVIGRVTETQYSFGFTDDPTELIEPGREIGRLLAGESVDLVVLVPA